ncbi:uncharacterized protein LOC130898146 [Diorhabda carinulata]|uniref:uncharacterized protein LOC130898146 n=1 Tax=Diorhabda carinulata TaxID=1163345 RepID=UPI0025A11FF1|nr:uncharacterized protein LOC130898146 [Diorhabda carinulata]
MNLGTWNVQGLSTKINEVLREIRQLNMDIVVLTETKKKGQDSENLGHYDHFYSGISKDKRAQKGVSILIKKSLRKYVSSWEAVNQRIIKINIAICGNKTTVIGTYGINEDDTVNNKDDYFECLSEEISKVGTSREVIILGDLNARTGKKIDDQMIVGRFGEEVTNDNGNRLITLCQQNTLKILNGFFQHKMIHKYTWENFDNPEQHYSFIKKSMIAAAEEAFGRSDNTRRPRTYWWDKEIEDLINDKKVKFSKFLCTKNDNDKRNFKEAQTKVRKAITKKKNETWEKTCTQINTYLGGSRNTESWKTLKSLREDRSNNLISPITLEKWDEYFSILFTETRPEFKNQRQDNINIITSPLRITIKEVKDVCQSLKNRKSPGAGQIAPELIKNGTEKLFSHLQMLFQKCINGEALPQEWKTSYMTTVYKKGGRENCDNYRGLTVLCTISRIYGKIIKNKIEQEYCNMEAEEQKKQAADGHKHSSVYKKYNNTDYYVRLGSKVANEKEETADPKEHKVETRVKCPLTTRSKKLSAET